MKTRTEIINALFESYDFQSYLEIGVCIPAHNFDLINASIKESVDPNQGEVYTYNITSDDFFKNYVGNKNYDVVFIDGLHTEEQVYKDVYNSIKHLCKDGFIVLHDCNPATEFLARSYDEFKEVGGDWNGTVYKAFIRLKSELKDWSCFVVDEDFGCGIITQRKLLKNKILNISKFNWNKFDENRKALLQLITFNKYIKIIKL